MQQAQQRTIVHDVPPNIYKHDSKISKQEAQHIQTHARYKTNTCERGASNFQCKGVEDSLPQGGAWVKDERDTT